MTRVENAYRRYKKIWGNEEPSSLHPAILYPEEAMELIEMATRATPHEEDIKYLLVLYAFGAGYMLGYEEGCKDK